MNAGETLEIQAHLKALRLPTVLREYAKTAADAAKAHLGHEEYLLRLSPVNGGMRPFFFVYAGGVWGAPVSGPILRKGDEVNLVAVWTGESIHLFTNGLSAAAGQRAS